MLMWALHYFQNNGIEHDNDDRSSWSILWKCYLPCVPGSQLFSAILPFRVHLVWLVSVLLQVVIPTCNVYYPYFLQNLSYSHSTCVRCVTSPGTDRRM